MCRHEEVGRAYGGLDKAITAEASDGTRRLG